MALLWPRLATRHVSAPPQAILMVSDLSDVFNQWKDGDDAGRLQRPWAK